MPQSQETSTISNLSTIAKQFGRGVIFLHNNDRRIIVYDKEQMGDGFIRQFPLTSDGLRRACRWAVNLNEADEDSVTKPLDALIDEYRHNMKEV